MKKIEFWMKYFVEHYGQDYKFMTYSFNFHFLYRGRPFGVQSLEQVKEDLWRKEKIWCPDKDNCSKQRCSEKGERKLYLSSNVSSIPKEIGSNVGDLIGVVKYKQLEEFSPLSIVGLEDLLKLDVSGDFIPKLKDHHNGKSEKIIRIDSIMSNIFRTKRRDDGFDIYDPTIAISHLYLSRSVGMIYPSVAAGYKSFNIVLHPDKVESTLKPIEIGIYKVMDISSNEYTDLLRISNGLIQEDGRIDWIDFVEPNVSRFEK